ncbi:MAG: DUF1289 domain-containing protein [Cohaesibacter sp.]|nr:DUF1289 domain-containing protein [Cohaesibacter sp.]
MAILSPCVKSCRLDDESQLCFGCGRHVDEIMNWRYYSNKQRTAIMDELDERMAKAFSPPVGTGS